MLTDDLFRDAVLWGRQEGGEDRSSVGWQRRTVSLICMNIYPRTEDSYTTSDCKYRRRDPAVRCFFLLRNKLLCV